MTSTLAALSARTGLRRVLVAYAAFCVVEMYGWLVVILWAFDRGGPSLAAVASVAQLVPAAVLAPAAGGVADRMPRGTALALTHGLVAVGALATFVALAAYPEPVAVIGASTLLTIALAFVRPAHYAALPQLASESPAHLVSANALSSVMEGASRFVGPVAAGAAYAAISPTGAMAVAVVLSVLASVLCLRLRLARADVDAGESGLRAALGGFRALWSDRASFALLLVMATTFVLAGALDIVGVAFAQSVLEVDDTATGLIIGSLGVGGLLGALVGGAVAGRRRLGRYIVGGMVLGGLAFAAVSLLDLIGPVVLMLVVTGIGATLTLVAGRTLLQRSTDDAVLARVFAVQESISLIGVAVGAAVAPFLIAWLGERYAWVPLGAACALAALLCVRAIQRLESRARYLPEELAALSDVPFLDLLPQYELERMALRTHWREVPEGHVVVRQGEQGHEFFVIVSGEASVHVDGLLRPKVLEVGDFFGEVALLHSVPRTATVTALAPMRLLVVGREDFLAAVTGDPDGHAVAREMGASYEDRRIPRGT